MRITRRPAEARGRTWLDWLDSRHTFSFGEYHDPAHMGFRALRVINDDVVEPARGFGPHSHRDAEILTYVLEGRLAHEDSMGNGSVITAGNLQYMSAGDGVTHSEINPSQDERVHFLQIWILPDPARRGGPPRYAERQLAGAVAANALTLLFTGAPRKDAVEIRADADVYLARLDVGGRSTHALAPGRGAWIHVVAGTVNAMGELLAPGDGAAIEEASEIHLEGHTPAELLLFDMR